MVRELILGMASAFGVLNDGSQDDGCTPRQKERCRELYGTFFEATCKLCPDNPDRSVTNGQQSTAHTVGA